MLNSDLNARSEKHVDLASWRSLRKLLFVQLIKGLRDVWPAASSLMFDGAEFGQEEAVYWTSIVHWHVYCVQHGKYGVFG